VTFLKSSTVSVFDELYVGLKSDGDKLRFNWLAMLNAILGY